MNWSLLVLPLLITPYHVANIARVSRHRLPKKYALKIALQTALWLLSIQIALFVCSIFLAQSWFILLVFSCCVQLALSLVFLYQTLRTWKNIHPDHIENHLSDTELPSLSVLVPARNETLALQNCLTALVKSDYPKLEIIALDDRSADLRTPEIIRSFAHEGVRFVSGDEPTPEMLPKNHAYARLAQESSGELLLFMGADVILEPSSLRRLVEQLVGENRDMISVLPLRPVSERSRLNLIQSMRYWWELGFPRRLFNRPPVLSTVWLIRSTALEKNGGFAACKRMITPEAYFARQLIASDSYIFLRSTPSFAVYSTKGKHEQLATAIRVRYPQLHRRIEQLVLVSLFELYFLILPFVFLPILVVNSLGFYLISLNLLTLMALYAMYYVITVRTHLNSPVRGMLTMPLAFVLDIGVMHLSMWRYEFGRVVWHDRNLSRPMQEVQPSLPPIDIT